MEPLQRETAFLLLLTEGCLEIATTAENSTTATRAQLNKNPIIEQLSLSLPPPPISLSISLFSSSLPRDLLFRILAFIASVKRKP